jgi:hypothetical protein
MLENLLNLVVIMDPERCLIHICILRPSLMDDLKLEHNGEYYDGDSDQDEDGEGDS